MTVTWQGDPVTGPLMIYHSEIPDTANGNGLICSHPTRTDVAWHIANGGRLIESGGTFNNIITNGGRQAQIMRGTLNQDERFFDGLWTCRLNGAAGAGAFHVGVYDDSPTSSKIAFPFHVDFPQQNSQFLLISLILPNISSCYLIDIQHNYFYIL